jgi:hypothetical protein
LILLLIMLTHCLCIRYALRVMTASMVLYDRITPTGVFSRAAGVHTRKCLRTLAHRSQGESK